MSITTPFHGSLFVNDFLCESITKLPDWQEIDDSTLDTFKVSSQHILSRFPTRGTPNESQTEDDLIWPVLGQLGWRASLRQQNLSARGREDVPDGLLFADDAAKDRANGFAEEWKRYEFGLTVVESKRWGRPLDRRSGRRGEETAPSTQMLRYLRRVDDLTTGKLRWGILTNGARWRIYYQGARSVSEQFFEADLAALLDLPGHNDGLFALTEAERHHWLKVFVLVFRREAFLAGPTDPRTFHQRAIEEGRFYEERVAASLSALVFEEVFPKLARAIAAAAPEAPLPDVREASLVLLYRLLFILYAEDRDLLPVRNTSYDDYALREKVRGDIGQRKDHNDIFSASAARYWSVIDDLCRAIDQGDPSIGLPPYNGGLFDRQRVPLLANIRIADDVMADVIDVLSFEQTPNGRRYINYRDLGVQQLGSIYERLIEHEIVRDGGEITVRPNVFARKGSGSYYTPDDLVALIIKETIEPLVQSRIDDFNVRNSELATSRLPEDRRIGRLKQVDPAEKLLELKVCDPAMGSGHFLVNLVDHLADRVITAMADAEATVDDYISPLTERIDTIRNTIIDNAEKRGWTINAEQLDDRHIVRRMVLKRCVYGVDKNPMAVELAKVALWLHTFTVGAPLSFLDHHLRCGDSLFGSWVRASIDRAAEHGGLFLEGPVKRAMRAAAPMQILEGLTDAEIAEAHRSADVFTEIEEMTAPLNAFLAMGHAFDWLNIRDRDDKAALGDYFIGIFGDPIDIASSKVEVSTETEGGERFVGLLTKARQILDDERFLNWQVAFPGVWSAWESDGLNGGFDAVIGNPPWDRMRVEPVEWFAVRRREIAMAVRAADRKRMVAALRACGDPLAAEFDNALSRAEAAAQVARTCGDYPLLAFGRIEPVCALRRARHGAGQARWYGRATHPVRHRSDKTAARFFKGVSTEGRLRALYDFENRRTRYNAPPFFPDVDSRFKFCAFVASPTPTDDPAMCAFFLQDVSELDNPDRRFPLTAEDFSRVNPNTGTAPIFRSRRAAELTTAIYGRLPVLVDRSSGGEVKAWPVKYTRMFDMSNDSRLFRTREELEEEEGAYPVGGNRFGSPSGDWVPLYVGRMIHQFDHRAASVDVNVENLHNPALSADLSAEQKADPAFVPTPQYWVSESEVSFPAGLDWTIAFRDIARATDVRTMIAAAVPSVGLGNTAPAIFPEDVDNDQSNTALLLANLGVTILDFVVRQKAQSTHLNWYIVEQLPVVPPARYVAIRFGPKTADEIVREAVLELTYTAHDMVPFARDMGYVNKAGRVKPPFTWDEARRLHLRAKLDAVFFHLYGVTDRDDIRYIYSTFPIVERHETVVHGCYYSRDLCLAYMNALASGNPDAKVQL